MKDPVGYLDAIVPEDLAADLRDRYRRGFIQPLNALTHLRLSKLIDDRIDALDVGTWLRLSYEQAS